MGENVLKTQLVQDIIQSRSLRTSTEGNTPKYVSTVLQKYIGRPVKIIGYTDADDCYLVELDKLTDSKEATFDKSKLRRLVGKTRYDLIRSRTQSFPQVLIVNGEANGISKTFWFSKVVKVQSDDMYDNFFVDNEHSWPISGYD